MKTTRILAAVVILAMGLVGRATAQIYTVTVEIIGGGGARLIQVGYAYVPGRVGDPDHGDASAGVHVRTMGPGGG